jgi:hydroxyacylglutathione hydrolase
MLSIEQFRYGDNLAYLLYGSKEAMAVDGGAWQEILAFLEKTGLALKYVTNTHRHYDHTPGDEHLLKKTKAVFLDCAKLVDNETILVDDKPVVVYRTPGHSADSVCFHAGNNLITGDTLFNTDFHRPFNRQKNNNQAVQTILSGQLLSQGILNGLASFSTPIRMGV